MDVFYTARCQWFWDMVSKILSLINQQGRPHVLTGSAVGHRSLAPGFKARPGYVRRVFHLSLRLITFEGR
jgi:hypothetical protein